MIRTPAGNGPAGSSERAPTTCGAYAGGGVRFGSLAVRVGSVSSDAIVLQSSVKNSLPARLLCRPAPTEDYGRDSTESLDWTPNSAALGAAAWFIVPIRPRTRTAADSPAAGYGSGRLNRVRALRGVEWFATGPAAGIWPQARTPPTRLAREARSLEANGLRSAGPASCSRCGRSAVRFRSAPLPAASRGLRPLRLA